MPLIHVPSTPHTTPRFRHQRQPRPLLESAAPRCAWYRVFPSLKRRGGALEREPDRAKPQERRRGGQTGEIFRLEDFGRTDYPVCAFGAATPPFQGGETSI